MPRRTNRTAVYADRLVWEPLEVKGSQGYAWIKTLAKDDETGARTALVKFDPGFKAPASVAQWPMDMYVLEGGMRAGDRAYNKDTFHYRPAGTPIGAIDCPQGITRLVFTADSRDRNKSSSEEVFVQNVATDIPFGPSNLGPLDPNAKVRGHKYLRRDKAAGTTLWTLTNFKRGVWDRQNQIHIHDHVEEVYVVEGEIQDYLGDVDGHWRWVPGTYVERPANESLHGDSLMVTDKTTIIVREGWLGDYTKYYELGLTHTSPEWPVPPVSFVE